MPTPIEIVTATLAGVAVGITLYIDITALWVAGLRHRRRRAELPEPPENARLEHIDGSVIPLELVYVGRDEADCEIWESTPLMHLMLQDGGWRLSVDVFPAKTGIRL